MNKFDYCPFCKKPFVEGDKVSRFRAQGEGFFLAHFGCGCEHESEMKKPDSSVSDQLSEDSKLWRYMDLFKFISMMKNRSLYFSSPSSFEDIFEGAHGLLENKWKWDKFYSEFFRVALITAPDNCWHKVNDEYLEENTSRLLSEITETKARGVFVSCWHWNDFESEAMWKLYSSGKGNAIAIQTSFGALKEELGDTATIKPVHYIDFSSSFSNINELYLYKRKAFEYEHEVRAVIHDFKSKDASGIEKEVDINKLVSNVYLSPYSPDWYKEIVEELVARFGYKIKVHKSGMTQVPF